jgi:ribonuclease T2
LLFICLCFVLVFSKGDFIMKWQWIGTAILALVTVLLPQLAAAQQKTGQETGKTEFILAASWQPAFCERQSKKPECRDQTASRFDAGHFSLHGLWPMRKTYCGVAEEAKALDRKSDWNTLPAVALSADLGQSLARVMPGTRSGLDRHEWIKHGSCMGMTADAYFGTAVDLIDTLNGSAVGALFAGHIGQTLTADAITAAFDQSFGAGSGARVKMRCVKDGDRRMISGLTIGLGNLSQLQAGSDAGPAPLGALMLAGGTTKFGCPEGVVDAAGLQ